VTVSRVLITGAAGFLGGAVSRACETLWPEAEVLGVGRHPESPNVHAACDLGDTAAVAAIVRRFAPDVVFHMAGSTRNADWPSLWAANVLPLANVLDAVATHAQQCRVVVPGSAAEYGEWGPGEGPLTETHELRPSSPYGVSKVWQTTLAQSYAKRGVDVVVGRVFNLSGATAPEHLVLGTVAAQLGRIRAGESEPVVRLGDTSAVRDFIDVDDACGALLTLAIQGRAGEIYNICSGKPCVVADAVRELVTLSATGAQVVSEAAPSDRGGISWSVGSNAKILAETEWRPRVSLTKSLASMLADPLDAL